MKLLIMLLNIGLISSDDSRPILNAVFREMYFNATSETCPNCGDNQIALESVMSENEIKRYRIEMLKQAILDNLGLDQPPVLNQQQWPPHFKTDQFFKKFTTKTENQEEQSLHEKLFLIPKDISCNIEEVLEMEELSIKMNYHLPESLDANSITSAVVWLDSVDHRDTYMDKQPKPFYMELVPCGQQTNEHTTTFRGFQSFNGEWIELDAMPVMGSWLDKKQTCFTISLTMKNWSTNYCKLIMDSDHQPFLTLHYRTGNKRNQSRLKRSRDCTKGSSECCRENLHISIDDIGWGKFIVHPPDFDAYYCKGSCKGAITQSATLHNSFIQQLISTGKDVSSCCAPTKLLPMDFFVKYSNNSIIQTPMSNIIVASCGCM